MSCLCSGLYVYARVPPVTFNRFLRSVSLTLNRSGPSKLKLCGVSHIVDSAGLLVVTIRIFIGRVSILIKSSS